MKKRCRECGEIKDASAFQSNYKSRDGYTHVCKACMYPPRPRVECSVDGCCEPRYSHGLCQRHWSQLRKKGKVAERTYRDWNRIVELNTHAEVILEDKDCNEVGRCLVDLADVELVRKHCWCWTGDYVQSSLPGGKKLSLARYLLGVNAGGVFEPVAQTFRLTADSL